MGRLSTIFNLKDEKYSKCPPEEIKERIMAVIMVDQSCEERFADFKKDRNEDAHLGRDDFPATRTRSAVALDNHCNIDPKPKPSIRDGGRDDSTPASSFAQFVAKDVDGGIYPHIKCHNCDKYGHYKGAFPKKKRSKRKKNENDDDDTDKD